MTTPWGLPDFDAHEEIHFVTDEKCGLKAIIAIHSTHLGPAGGGARFWHYAKDEEALVDALRLSRGMSYKNAMAGLPLGGGKSVLLADANRTKTPDMLHAFGKAVDGLGGRYVTAEDAGSVATGVALHACAEGAKLSIADVDQAKAQKLAAATKATVVSTDEILGLEADVISPNALGAILTEQSIAALKAPIVAGGANNQLETPEDGQRLHARGILYAPDYVINAGGIINVCTEYLGDGDASLVRQRIEGIPVRLEQIWAESQNTGRDPAAVADAMAQRLIGRA
jgi:leucine dehydrogenase